MTISLEVLLKGSDYKLSQFKPAHINALQAAITLKDASKSLRLPSPAWCVALKSFEKTTAHETSSIQDSNGLFHRLIFRSTASCCRSLRDSHWD